VDDIGNGDIERTIIGAGFGYGLTPVVDLYGELGYIAEAELEDVDDDDDGFLFGGGFRGIVYHQSQFSLHGRGGFRFITEDYGDDADGDLTEVELGLVARYAVNRQLGIYGGLDLVPFSDGDIDVSGGGSADIERDDLLGVRLGIEGQLEGIGLNAEFGLVSEEAFIFRATIPL
ncbi:MAG: hypothetical protein KDD69_08375, partial [Bdellovibrionales bacterium]|nr:hypothetical protein [Bdellovibrionales bacterium]